MAIPRPIRRIGEGWLINIDEESAVRAERVIRYVAESRDVRFGLNLVQIGMKCYLYETYSDQTSVHFDTEI